MAEPSRCPRCGTEIAAGTPEGLCRRCLLEGVLRPGAGLHIRCPHCHNPVELVDSASQVEISCPSCGSHFCMAEAETRTHGGETLRMVAHYELLEQVGMGHFGAVWKARDTQLDRIVAVKIPRRGQLDPGEIDRFVYEARAAAQVRHPHIVGIHDVGCDDESVYIVSDYVEGASLSEWLTARRLTIEEAIRLCIKVARALHEAHEAGVVHRDVKPGNIMLDAAGVPYLTDFGLAKRETGEITVTLEGRILGTPAYMSPEQARGKPHEADRRSDVYSLGVVLFQLLTGELPFRGESRMLILQIIEEEPPSPRRLNARVSRDLETVCLKCLQKDPRRRYATAAELADELERCLAGRPILARPVGRLERLARACRRHPLEAVLSLSLALAIVGSLAVITVLWLEARDSAAEARHSAAEARQFAEKYRREAARAERHFQKAQQAVNDFFVEVSHSPEYLGYAPGTQRLRSKLLGRARTYYEEFVREAPAAQLKPELAEICLNLGVALRDAGESEAGRKSFLRAVRIYEALLAAEPRSAKLQAGLALAQFQYGLGLDDVGRDTEARACYQQAIDGFDRLLAARPDDRECQYGLGMALGNLARQYTATRDLPQAERCASRAVATWLALAKAEPDQLSHQYDLALDYMHLANVFHATGREEEALATLRKAKDLYAMLCRRLPPGHCHESYALACMNLATMDQRDRKATLALLREAVRVLEMLVAYNPAVARYREDLGGAYSVLAQATEGMGDSAQAEQLYVKAMSTLELAVQQDADSCEAQAALAQVYADVAQREYQRGHAEAAARFGSKAVEIVSRLADSLGQVNPSVASQEAGMGGTWTTLAAALREAGMLEQSVRAAEQAVAVYEKAHARTGSRATRIELADGYINLGDSYPALGRHAEAKERLQQALGLLEPLLQESPQDADLQRSLAAAYMNLATVHRQTGDPAGSADFSRRALIVLGDLPGNAAPYPRRLSMAGCLVNLSNALRDQGQNDEALPLLDEADDLLTALLVEEPTQLTAQRFLRNALIGKAAEHQRRAANLAESDPAGSAQAAQRSLQALTRVGQQARVEPDMLWAAARLCLSLSDGATQRNAPAEAEAVLALAAQLLERLCQARPGEPNYACARAAALTHWAALDGVGQNYDRALELVGQAGAILAPLQTADPPEAVREVAEYARKVEARVRNDRAWCCATASDAAARNGAQALQDAQRACELTEWKEPMYLDTLAAAYAELGRFDEARQWQQQAIDLAPEAMRPPLAEHLALFDRQEPVREPPPATVEPAPPAAPPPGASEEPLPP